MEIAPGDHLSHPNCSLCTRKPRIMCVHHSVLFHLWHTTGQLTVFKSSKQINSMAADGRILFYFFLFCQPICGLYRLRVCKCFLSMTCIWWQSLSSHSNWGIYYTWLYVLSSYTIMCELALCVCAGVLLWVYLVSNRLTSERSDFWFSGRTTHTHTHKLTNLLLEPRAHLIYIRFGK